MPKKASPKGKAAQERVSAKISKLHKSEPEMPHEQHVAMAINMEKKHRLTAKGEYKPAMKKK